jgi:hypothetical protein
MNTSTLCFCTESNMDDKAQLLFLGRDPVYDTKTVSMIRRYVVIYMSNFEDY